MRKEVDLPPKGTCGKRLDEARFPQGSGGSHEERRGSRDNRPGLFLFALLVLVAGGAAYAQAPAEQT
ncbi:MAG: hypothetical protein HY654_13185, partial [Acidobacteria bacterium]|nr:hypothetical protein [Acidobacteriota bacterium]